MISALAEEYSSEVTFIKADIDDLEGGQLAEQKEVHYIPAFFFINREGEVVQETSGQQTSNSLRDGIEQIMEE